MYVSMYVLTHARTHAPNYTGTYLRTYVFIDTQAHFPVQLVLLLENLQKYIYQFGICSSPQNDVRKSMSACFSLERYQFLVYPPKGKCNLSQT